MIIACHVWKQTEVMNKFDKLKRINPKEIKKLKERGEERKMSK